MLTEGDLREFTAPVIVWDENTSEAVEEAHGRCGGDLPGDLPFRKRSCGRDDRSVEILEETLPDETDLILAVGGGTIHDLSRYVAYERRIPFISVPHGGHHWTDSRPTDSVLFWKGEKKRFQAEGPLYVFAGYQHFFRGSLSAYGFRDISGAGQIYLSGGTGGISHLVTREYLCEEICGMEYRAVQGCGETAG